MRTHLSYNLFSSQACGKTRSFLIDVVVPRKIREVHGLLVIGTDALKPHLVTDFPGRRVT